MSRTLVAALGSLLLALLVTPLVAWRCPATLLDVPNQRSSHFRPTPRAGGIAVILAIAVVVAISARPSLWLVAPAVAIALVGLADDLWSAPVTLRLVAQVATAGVVVTLVGQRVGPLVPGVGTGAEVAATAATVVFVAGFVNAFNFMDGVNGMSGLNAAVIGTTYAGIAHAHGLPGLPTLALVVAGAALGFLPWNLSGRIFLGDVGSYGLGCLLAGLGCALWAAGVSPLLILAPLTIYLCDTGTGVVRRLLTGRRLSEAHRDFVYQRLVRQGLPHAASASWCALLTVAASLVAVVVGPAAPVLLVLGAMAFCGVYLASPLALALARRRGGPDRMSMGVT